MAYLGQEEVLSTLWLVNRLVKDSCCLVFASIRQHLVLTLCIYTKCNFSMSLRTGSDCLEDVICCLCPRSCRPNRNLPPPPPFFFLLLTERQVHSYQHCPEWNFWNASETEWNGKIEEAAFDLGQPVDIVLNCDLLQLAGRKQRAEQFNKCPTLCIKDLTRWLIAMARGTFQSSHCISKPVARWSIAAAGPRRARYSL